MAETRHRQQVPAPGEDTPGALAADGYDMQDLGATDEAPPAYGDHMDQLQLSQAGFEAGATVTNDGRVNININETDRKFASFIAPALRVPSHQTPAAPLPPAYIPPSLGGLPGQVPPPKLNVVIQIVGSRGDVQPFVALGKVLKETYGHRVRLATHATFQKFVEENGLEFFAIGGDPAELMAFMVKNPGLMPGMDALKSGEITKRRQGIEQIVVGCWRSCFEAGTGLGPPYLPHKVGAPLDQHFVLPGNPDDRPFVADVIIANPPSFAHIHIAEKLGIPLHMMFTMPWSPTRAFPHPLANIESSNTDVVMTNYVSYALVEMMTWQGLGDVINRFRTKVLNLDPLALMWAPGLLTRLQISTTYCWSPALIPKPNDWGREISIAGFYFLNLASSYTPEPDLAAFLDAGPPPVYIGFGSIVVDDPNHLTEMIFKAISIAGVRALVSKGWGGIGGDAMDLPDGVFMLGNCPHDWLFQRVSCVVHHGGAGTSAAGINLGKPTVVVPFFGDQPFWGAMISRAGAGPDPIPYKKLTAESLAAAIQEALKPETQARAKELGEKIREEKGADMGGKYFHDSLDLQSLRCSLAPSRVAVWRVRRTQIRLSALAAAVLAREGKLKYTDLKLYRGKEYATEDQPWDPITAVTSSLVGDISSIAMAVADLPRELFRGGKKKGESSASGAGAEEPPKTTTPPAELEQAPGTEPEGAAHTEADVQSMDTRSETASLPSTRPSLAPSNGETPAPSVAVTSTRSTTDVTSQSGDPETPNKLKKGKAPAKQQSSPAPITLDTAVASGKGVSRIVTTGLSLPMNVCLGLARGFRNAPRLYNDDTVRETEKVTDFNSGLKVAGKEFAFGLYDGLAGLVTQPLKGAEKEGAAGLIKGFGKGLGGLVLKHGAAFWSLPAYTMQGVYVGARNMTNRSMDNYILTARILQGEEEHKAATPEERRDILDRWSVKGGLKGFYLLKQKERKGQQQDGEAPADEHVDVYEPPPKTGWFHTRHLSLDERKKLHERKEAWKKRQAAYRGHDQDEFERAIRESVRQTSRGDPDEDAHIEAIIRTSLAQMQQIANTTRNRSDSNLAAASGSPLPSSIPEGVAELDAGGPIAIPAWPHDEITDEEYQEFIAQAVQRSLTDQQASAALGHASASDDDEFHRALEASRAHEHPDHHDDHEEEMRRALEESEKAHREHLAGDGANDEDELRRALEESERAHRLELERKKTEEDMILEFVRKQSLAEEEFRRQKAKGKGKTEQHHDDDEDDEDLKRALEESLRISGRAGEGSASAGGAGGAGGGAHEGAAPPEGASAAAGDDDGDVSKPPPVPAKEAH